MHSTVYSLFVEQIRRAASAVALVHGARTWTYVELGKAVDHAAARLREAGFIAGDRLAVLSENRPEYLILQLASARLGVIVACLNWRLTAAELQRCISLVTPRLMLSSKRFETLGAQARPDGLNTLTIDEFLTPPANTEVLPPDDVDPEAGLLLICTSGTTGEPKAALISQRAEIARMAVLRMDLGLATTDTFVAWAPMFHMGGTEHSLAALMSGGSVIVDALERYQVGWLLLVPATIEPVLAEIRRRGARIAGVRVVGCMADLVSPTLIAQLTGVLGARFLNSFGSTETGLPPASGDLIPAGVEPTRLGKSLNSLCEVRLIDSDGAEVEQGETGDMAVRGPTLFSGYWSNEMQTASVFERGWYRMGDLFRRDADGRFHFVGRAKYLIKSGGENIYPAEIERVLLSDPRIADAAVVRKADPTWGEIPVAFVARKDDSITATDVQSLCRRQLASYKCPREVIFIDFDRLPRNATGKIIRESLEQSLVAAPSGVGKALKADIPTR